MSAARSIAVRKPLNRLSMSNTPASDIINPTQLDIVDNSDDNDDEEKEENEEAGTNTARDDEETPAEWQGCDGDCNLN